MSIWEGRESLYKRRDAWRETVKSGGDILHRDKNTECESQASFLRPNIQDKLCCCNWRSNIRCVFFLCILSSFLLPKMSTYKICPLLQQTLELRREPESKERKTDCVKQTVLHKKERGKQERRERETFDRREQKLRSKWEKRKRKAERKGSCISLSLSLFAPGILWFMDCVAQRIPSFEKEAQGGWETAPDARL